MYQSDGTVWPVFDQRFADIQSIRERFVVSTKSRTVLANTRSKKNVVFVDMSSSLCEQKPLEYSRYSQ